MRRQHQIQLRGKAVRAGHFHVTTRANPAVYGHGAVVLFTAFYGGFQRPGQRDRVLRRAKGHNNAAQPGSVAAT